MRRSLVLALVLAVSGSATVWVSAQSAPAATGYQLPPKVIVDILDAAPPPTVELSPTRDVDRAARARQHADHRGAVAADAAARRPCASTRGPTGRTARSCRARSRSRAIADGAEKKVTLPPNPALAWIGFSPDGKRFAFTQTRDNGIELWVGDTATGSGQVGHARAAQRVARHAVRMGRRRRLAALCASCSPSRGAAPPTPTRADRPEHPGESRQGRRRSAPIRTCSPARTTKRCSTTTPRASSRSSTRPAVSARRSARPRCSRRSLPSPDGNFVLVEPRAAPVFVARALHELPVDRRGVGSQGRGREADRRAAGRRHGAERRRAARARAAISGSRSRRRPWSGPRRSTTATRRPRCRIATR